MTEPAPTTADPDPATAPACDTDGGCPPGSGCCAPAPTSGRPGGRGRMTAPLLGLLCIAGCAAGPVLLGAGALVVGAGVARLSVVAGAVVAVAALTVVAVRRRSAGRAC